MCISFQKHYIWFILHTEEYKQFISLGSLPAICFCGALHPVEKVSLEDR